MQMKSYDKSSSKILSVELLSKSMIHQTSQNLHSLWPSLLMTNERLKNLDVEPP